MENITITAAITYPRISLEAFADRRGYMPEIINPAYTETVTENGVTTNGEPQFIQNPEDRVAFLQRWFKENAINLFSVDIEKEARRVAEETRNSIIATEKAKIEQAIVIS